MVVEGEGLNQAPTLTSQCAAQGVLSEAQPKVHLKLRLKRPSLTLQAQTGFGREAFRSLVIKVPVPNKGHCNALPG
jgi:hypothetical protein